MHEHSSIFMEGQKKVVHLLSSQIFCQATSQGFEEKKEETRLLAAVTTTFPRADHSIQPLRTSYIWDSSSLLDLLRIRYSQIMYFVQVKPQVTRMIAETSV